MRPGNVSQNYPAKREILQEIVFVLIYILYTITIQKSWLRRFEKESFFRTKTNIFTFTNL